jgi:import inner membrane translocase subunit TIM17
MAVPPPPQQQQAMVEHGREPCPDRILGAFLCLPAPVIDVRRARIVAPVFGCVCPALKQKPHIANTTPTQTTTKNHADDIGGAFGMGALGGGLWHTYRGLKNSPRGYKIAGTLETIRRESPRIGGNFANWGLMFSVFDCSCMYIRQKEDPFNAIMAGALTGGFLQIRSGLKPAFRSAVFGGVLLVRLSACMFWLVAACVCMTNSKNVPQPQLTTTKQHKQAVIEGLGITLSKMMAAPPPGAPQPPPGMVPGAPPPGPQPLPPPLVTDLGASLPSGSGDAGTVGVIGAESSGNSSGGGGWWSWITGGEDKVCGMEGCQRRVSTVCFHAYVYLSVC